MVKSFVISARAQALALCLKRRRGRLLPRMSLLVAQICRSWSGRWAIFMVWHGRTPLLRGWRTCAPTRRQRNRVRFQSVAVIRALARKPGLSWM